MKPEPSPEQLQWVVDHNMQIRAGHRVQILDAVQAWQKDRDRATQAEAALQALKDAGTFPAEGETLPSMLAALDLELKRFQPDVPQYWSYWNVDTRCHAILRDVLPMLKAFKAERDALATLRTQIQQARVLIEAVRAVGARGRWDAPHWSLHVINALFDLAYELDPQLAALLAAPEGQS